MDYLMWTTKVQRIVKKKTRKIQKIVSISDIGLITKMSQNQEDVIVLANSIMQTTPIAGLEIKLISNNNQEITKGTTDANGMVVFKNLKKDNPNFTVAMVTANSKDDFNYLLFDDTEIETSKFDITGKNFNEAGLDAFIYGDREIYRPGETINLNTESYTFSTNAVSGSDRFSLTLGSIVTGVDALEGASGSTIYIQNERLFVANMPYGASVSLFSQEGKLLLTGNTSAEGMDISTLSTGLYVAKASDAKAVITSKIIVQ